MEIGAVALLDVLGWKGIWQRSDTALDDIQSLVDDANHKSREWSFNKKRNAFGGRFDGLQANVISISDTIAITVVGKLDLTVEFISLLSMSAIFRSIEKGIPVRGAISYGRFLTKKNVLLGPAVDEVASWYEQAEWIGVSLTPTAALQVNRKKLYAHSALVDHDLPTKAGMMKNTVAVNWPRYYHPEAKDHESRRVGLIGALTGLGPVTSEIGPKILNTIAFFDAHCKKGET